MGTDSEAPVAGCERAHRADEGPCGPRCYLLALAALGREVFTAALAWADDAPPCPHPAGVWTTDGDGRVVCLCGDEIPSGGEA